MKRFITGMLIAALAVAISGVAMAQEEAHFEGSFVNSTCPPTNPNPAVFGLEGRGLVTALYAPLTSSFVLNEYTWVIKGITPVANTVVGTTCYTSYAVAGALFTIYEDAGQDARPTFYNCPSDILFADPRYSNGLVYLRGHFTAFNSQYDTFSGTGTFTAQMNWDTGAHLAELPGGRRGVWTFGGTTTQIFACIPFANGYDQNITGRMFQLTTGTKNTTWGQLRNLYSK